MSKEYLEEMRKLEMQQNDLTSQYDNEEKENMQEADYKKLVNANLNFTPKKGETWQEYAYRVKLFADMASEKNRLTHIDGPRKAWYTHRNPMGCFMCEDTNLIHVLRRTVALMASQYPENKF